MLTLTRSDCSKTTVLLKTSYFYYFPSNVTPVKLFLKTTKKNPFVLREFIATFFIIILAVHLLATVLLQPHRKD